MIEPDHLTRQRMPRDGLTHLSRPQTIASPFGFNVRFAAVSLNGRPILGLKHGLPRERETVAKIPDQHPSLFDESFPYPRINTFEDFPTVRDRRLSALHRRHHTKEEDFQWPGALVRILVM